MKLLEPENSSFKTTSHKRADSLSRYYVNKLDPDWVSKRKQSDKARYERFMLDPLKLLERRKKNREMRYKHLYGITYKDKEDMYLVQNMQCKICEKTLLTFSHAHVDHNHNTGAVRALLCSRCNTGLGYIEDKQFNKNAMKYLKEHETN